MTPNTLRRSCAITLLAGSLAGCSPPAESADPPPPPSRDYALPEQLCDLPIEQQKFASFFPGGEEVTVVREQTANRERYGSFRCNYEVDGLLVLSVDAHFDEPQDLGRPPYQTSMVRRSISDDAKPTVVPGEYPAQAWPGAARALTQCSFRGNPQDYCVAVVSTHPEEEKHALAMVSDIIQPVARYVEEHCEEIAPDGEPK